MAEGEILKDKIKKQNKEEYAYKKMLSYGWKPYQASAIVGNLKRESNFDTSIVGTADDKGSAGVAQWHSGRLDKLKSMYGSNWTDFDNQLDFVNWELNNTHKSAGEALRQTKGVWDAGRVVTDKYEAPKVKWDRDETRQNYVVNNYRKYSGVALTEEDKTDFLKGTAQRAIDNYNSSIPSDPTIPYYTPEISNLVTPIELPTLAQENETEAVQKAKEELDYKQQQQINQQRFIQDLITASQVQYVYPNQVEQQDIYAQQEDTQFQKGGVIKDDNGYWNPNNWGKVVEINSPQITMQGVLEDLVGISNETGEVRLMLPGQNYSFPNTKKVTEYPLKNKRFS